MRSSPPASCIATRDEWTDHFAGADACVTPVLKLAEVPRHPQIAAGATIVSVDGVVHPAPAPRLDRTPGAIAGRASQPGHDTDEVLAELGYDEETVASLRTRGVICLRRRYCRPMSQDDLSVRLRRLELIELAKTATINYARACDRKAVDELRTNVFTGDAVLHTPEPRLHRHRRRRRVLRALVRPRWAHGGTS